MDPAGATIPKAAGRCPGRPTGDRRSPARAAAGRRSATAARASAANARRRSSSWSGIDVRTAAALQPPPRPAAKREKPVPASTTSRGIRASASRPGQPAQVSRERVDQRVNRLVRNRLLFVAPPARMTASPRSESPSRNRSISELLPAPERPCTNTPPSCPGTCRRTPRGGRQAGTHGPRTAGAGPSAATRRPRCRRPGARISSPDGRLAGSRSSRSMHSRSRSSGTSSEHLRGPRRIRPLLLHQDLAGPCPSCGKRPVSTR